MIKKLENCFFKKHVITTWFDKKWKNWHFLKKQFSSFLIISPVLFDLQKRAIPQNKAWNILFWPYLMIFSNLMNIFWTMLTQSCAVFFYPDFTWPREPEDEVTNTKLNFLQISSSSFKLLQSSDSLRTLMETTENFLGL